MRPLVSIGIPCLNAAKDIPAAIQCALDQTWSPCEVIVVDCGSSDTSLVQASAYGSRVTVIQSAGRSLTGARNMILHEARGEWLQFLPPGTLLAPDKIAAQLEEATAGLDADVLYGPPSGAVIPPTPPNPTRSSLSGESEMCRRWIERSLPPIHRCLWRRTSLIEIGGWRNELACCHEEELYARAIREGLIWQTTPCVGSDSPRADQTPPDPAFVIRTWTNILDGLQAWMVRKKIWNSRHLDSASRACFAMARKYARSSVKDASRYYRDRQKHGLMKTDPAFAGPIYRTALRLTGFAPTERLASIVRLGT